MAPLSAANVIQLFSDGLNPFTYAELYFPINHFNRHWALSQVSFASRFIHYYDSLPNFRSPNDLS
jgi:Ulp1 family protease